MLLLGGFGAARAGDSTIAAGPADGDGYLGSQACARCHSDQMSTWGSSMHAVAMRDARVEALVLSGSGSFGKDGSARIDFVTGDDGVSARITERGKARSVPVALTLGRRYLEQPVVSLESGRLQALPLARDLSVSAWFDVFAGEERVEGDYGHWSGRGMNANSQCLSCHTTDYRKGYSSSSGSYASTWSEAGVGCEACHGPGKLHAAQPQAPYGPFGRRSGIADFRPLPRARPSASATAPGRGA